MKKLHLITFLLFFSYSFAQQSEKNNRELNKDDITPVTLMSVSAYPNPFISDTSINFRSSKSQSVEFTVKNLLGTTVYGEKINANTGYNTILFNRNSLTKGMYIYSLQTEVEIISKRLIIK